MGLQRYRFTSQDRLTESAEYKRVFKQNTRHRDRYWIVLFSPNGKKKSRLGLAIAKKNVRYASQRNRIKRIVRESFRKEQLSGFDIVVMVKPGIDQIKSTELFSALEHIWQKMRR